jgi:hypothetical protein
MVVLFSSSVAVLAIALLRLVRTLLVSQKPAEIPARDAREQDGEVPCQSGIREAPWSGLAPSRRRAVPPEVYPHTTVAADIERRFATAFSTVPARRQEDLIAHALRRPGIADRREAMVHLLDEKAHGR